MLKVWIKLQMVAQRKLGMKIFISEVADFMLNLVYCVPVTELYSMLVSHLHFLYLPSSLL